MANVKRLVKARAKLEDNTAILRLGANGERAKASTKTRAWLKKNKAPWPVLMNPGKRTRGDETLGLPTT